MVGKLNFNRGQLADVTSDLNKGIASVRSGFKDTVQHAASKRKEADLNMQRAIENDRAQSRLDIAREQALRNQATFNRGETAADLALADSKAMSDILRGLPTEKDVTSTKYVGGTKGNADVIRGINKEKNLIAAETNRLNKEAEEASVKYSTLYDKYSTPSSVPTAVNPNDSKQVVTVKDNVPASNTTHYETRDGKEMSILGKLFGGYRGVDEFYDSKPDTIHGRGLIAPLPVETAENKANRLNAAHNLALKESGIDSVVGKIDSLKKAKAVPKLIKASSGTPVTTTSKSKLSLTEQKDRFRDQIRNSSMSGIAQMNALTKVDDMFAEEKEVKGPTISESLSLAKYRAGLVDDAKSVNAYRAIFPKMPESITNLTGAKAYADRMNAKDKKDNYTGKISTYVGTKLYGSITGKDDEDTEAIDRYIFKNAAALNKMTKKEADLLIAQKIAEYSRQSSQDPFDYLPGKSAASTVLEK